MIDNTFQHAVRHTTTQTSVSCKRCLLCLTDQTSGYMWREPTIRHASGSKWNSCLSFTVTTDITVNTRQFESLSATVAQQCNESKKHIRDAVSEENTRCFECLWWEPSARNALGARNTNGRPRVWCRRGRNIIVDP